MSTEGMDFKTVIVRSKRCLKFKQFVKDILTKGHTKFYKDWLIIK